MRIVSLVPSVTETLSSFNRTPIACTRFCERPDLVHVGGTKSPDLDEIASLSPDLVIMDEQENRREDYEELRRRSIRTHAMNVTSLASLNPSMHELANLVGATWTPVDFGREEPTRLRAFVAIWRRPWMALGASTYGASLLAHLGIDVMFAKQYQEVSVEEVQRERPDLVIAPSEPYRFSQRHQEELGSIAVPVFVDGKDLFWWGARSAAALIRLDDELRRR